MDVPIGAEVQCEDGVCGRTVSVVINPVAEAVTHIVVAGSGPGAVQRLVPIGRVADSSPQLVLLDCPKAEFDDMPSFVEYEYLSHAQPFLGYRHSEYWMWPMAIPDVDDFDRPAPDAVPLSREAIPPGELAIHKGTRVMAVDGRVGTVDELLAEPDTGHVTHLVMREGHLLGQREVTIPLAAIERLDDESVHLKLTRAEIAALPSIRLHRRWP